MKPFVLIEIESGNLTGDYVIGTTEVVAIVVDWDAVDLDPDAARELIDEISVRFPNNIISDQAAATVVDRLQAIVDEFEDDEEWQEYADDEDDDEGYMTIDYDAELEAEDEQRG